MKPILNQVWYLFDAIPESKFKMQLRLFLAFNSMVPRKVRRMSPINASIHRYVPKAGDIVVDAGAFPGDFTIYASRKVGPNGRILAFEPNPRNYECLASRVNEYGLTNVTLLRKGLWSHDGVLRMDGEGVDASLSDKGEHEVSIVSLDAELERLGLGKINMIKMDIEGAEIKALEGSDNALKNNPVHLAIGSYHEFEGEVTQPKVEAFLSAMGYQFITEYPERPNTYAWR